MRKGTTFYLALATILILSLIFTGCKSTASTTSTSAATATTSTTTKPAVTTSAPAITTSAPAITTSAPPVTTTSQTPSPVPTAQTGGILTVISPNSPTSFGYPIKSTGFAPIFAMQPCLEGFIDADIHGTILPKLALSWDIPADKSSITFKLRQGVKFHDGTPFNAQAAKWNLQLFKDRGTGSPADWTSIDVIDDYTIRISLKSFKNTQLSNMTYGMVSPDAVQKNGADWAVTHPVGTGPFKFKSFVPNTSMEFERNTDYWGDKANVDGIKFIYIVDATTAAMAFKGGDALVWESADAKTAYDMLKLGGYKEETRRGPLMNLIPDSKNPESPWSKLEVRQALEYAIDKQALVDTLGFGTWQAVNQPDVPEQFGYVANLANARNYDPAKAKDLLTKAGYPNGFQSTIITSSALPKDPLVAIQDYLAAVNIKVTIDVQSPAKWADTRASGWKNSLFYVTHGATDYNYCAYLERYYTPTSSFAYPPLAYPDGWVDLITKMMLTSDQSVMASMAKQAVQIHVDNAMVTPLFVRSEVYLMSNNVQSMGVGTHGDGFSWNTNKVWIKK
jgi:peptide/nickel transport system substrate-binding protein